MVRCGDVPVRASVTATVVSVRSSAVSSVPCAVVASSYTLYTVLALATFVSPTGKMEVPKAGFSKRSVATLAYTTLTTKATTKPTWLPERVVARYGVTG